MKSLLSLCLGFCLIAVSACDSETPSAEPKGTPYEPINLELRASSLVKSSNMFGANIFKEMLVEEEENSNLLISPLSIFQALSMTRNGANGQTKKEMNEVLAFDTSEGDDLNQYQKKLVDALRNADNKIDLNIANSIWYRDGISIESDFVKLNQDYFNAEVKALDFSDGAAAKNTINNWVDKQTKGKIPDIVDKVTADHVMFLINAIYFYGQWQNEFSVENTKKETFYLESGATAQVDMMHQEAELGYADNDLFRMIEMPYGNGHFNMMVLLPNDDKNVADLVEALNDDTWNVWMESISKKNVDLKFPKFKFEGDYELNDPLITMGMPSAFSPGLADFTGIVKTGNIHVSRVKHKTFIEVDEKGTEAAAVTSVEMEFTSAPAKTFFVANKPFLFAITEKDTQTILFMGKLMMPE